VYPAAAALAGALVWVIPSDGFLYESGVVGRG
jgi:hypothetical protein